MIAEYYPKEVRGVTLEELRMLIPFVQYNIRVYGKLHEQPRLTRWYGPVPYTYSGLTLEARSIPWFFQSFLAKAEAIAGVPFNSVLCNLYRDGRDTVGWHADDEAIFDPDGPVASFSFGSPRTFKMRLNEDHSVVRSYELEHGSLLLMGPGVQRAWQHTVPRTKKLVGSRINLTFRRCLSRL